MFIYNSVLELWSREFAKHTQNTDILSHWMMIHGSNDKTYELVESLWFQKNCLWKQIEQKIVQNPSQRMIHWKSKHQVQSDSSAKQLHSKKKKFASSSQNSLGGEIKVRIEHICNAHYTEHSTRKPISSKRKITWFKTFSCDSFERCEICASAHTNTT